MNFDLYAKKTFGSKIDFTKPNYWAARFAWNTLQQEVIKILKKNRYLESISYSGKECYKIYGNVIEKIEKL